MQSRCFECVQNSACGGVSSPVCNPASTSTSNTTNTAPANTGYMYTSQALPVYNGSLVSPMTSYQDNGVVVASLDDNGGVAISLAGFSEQLLSLFRSSRLVKVLAIIDIVRNRGIAVAVRAVRVQ